MVRANIISNTDTCPTDSLAGLPPVPARMIVWLANVLIRAGDVFFGGNADLN